MSLWENVPMVTVEYSETMTMSPETKKQIKTWLKVLLSFGLLSFFLSQAGLQETFGKLSNANLWLIPVCVLVYVLSQWISAYRWQIVSEPLDFHLSQREFFDLYFIGMFFNLFLPGAIGGDAVRVYYLAKRCKKSKRRAALTVLAERGVGLVALLLLTGMLCMTPVASPLPLFLKNGVLILSFMMCVGFLVLRKTDIDLVAKRYDALNFLSHAKVYWQDIPLLVRSVSLSLVTHSCMITIHFLIAVSLGVDLAVTVAYLTIVYGLVSLVSVIPIFFNGIGVREGAYQYLLGLVGLSGPVGLAFGLYWFLVSTFTSLIGGLVLIKGHYKTPTMEEVQAES